MSVISWAEECRMNRDDMYNRIRHYTDNKGVGSMNENDISELIIQLSVNAGSISPKSIIKE